MKSGKPVLLSLAAALITSAALIPSVAHSATNCTGLMAQLLTNSDITAATSVLTPAAGSNLAYCQVNITVSDLAGPENGYQPGQKQQIKIRIGLPPNAADGGSGGVQGNWNGRIEDLGGGGYAGSVGNVTGATNAGYVGSSTDTGHSGGSGSFALNPDNTLNVGLINDFAFNGIHAQSVWSKKLVQMYYGMTQKYTYWNGCSTGGRQGHQHAQTYPNEYDGILCRSASFQLGPFHSFGELWPDRNELGSWCADLVSQTECGHECCDRCVRCTRRHRRWRHSRSAHLHLQCQIIRLRCKGGKSNDPNCLTPAEASAVNKIWQGPPNQGQGQQRWFGLERGTPLTSLNGTDPFPIATDHLKYWVYQNPAFDWHTLTETTFNDALYASEIKFHDVIGTDDPDLSAFRKHGGKMITYHGDADILIFPRGTYNYYNRATDKAGGLKNVQKFYRFFPYPGNNHCGGNINQPNAPLINSGDLFKALVNWVENGVAPDSIVAYNTGNPATAT